MKKEAYPPAQCMRNKTWRGGSSFLSPPLPLRQMLSNNLSCWCNISFPFEWKKGGWEKLWIYGDRSWAGNMEGGKKMCVGQVSWTCFDPLSTMSYPSQKGREQKNLYSSQLVFVGKTWAYPARNSCEKREEDGGGVFKLFFLFGPLRKMIHHSSHLSLRPGIPPSLAPLSTPPRLRFAK